MYEVVRLQFWSERPSFCLAQDLVLALAVHSARGSLSQTPTGWLLTPSALCLENPGASQVQWLTPVIPALWEA